MGIWLNIYIYTVMNYMSYVEVQLSDLNGYNYGIFTSIGI